MLQTIDNGQQMPQFLDQLLHLSFFVQTTVIIQIER